MFDSKEFHCRVDECCNNKGTTITKMLKELGLSTSFGTNWKNGRAPTATVVKRIAEYLNVSTDYLLSNENLTNMYMLSKNELTLLTLFRQLTETEQNKMIAQVKTIAKTNS